MCVFFIYNSVFVRLSPQDFHIIPASFVISPVRNLLPGLTSKNFLKFEIFPGESSPPYRVTETGCQNYQE